MRIITFTLCLLAVLLMADCRRLAGLTAAGVDGRSYWVATNGDDDNDGSFAHPWATINHASWSVSPGDTVMVKSGTYNQFAMVWTNGTPSAWIVYKADGSGVYLNFTDTLDSHDGFQVNSSYTELDGFHITRAKYFPVRVSRDSYVVIKNCEIYGGRRSGLLIEDVICKYITVQNCEVHGNGTSTNLDHGIYVTGDYQTIEGNTVYDNSTYGIHLYSETGDKTVRHCIVRNNVCYGNGIRGTYGGAGIIVCDGLNEVYNNLCYGNGSDGKSNSAGIFLYSSPAKRGPIYVYHNTTYDNGGPGIYCYYSDSAVIKDNICLGDYGQNLAVKFTNAHAQLDNNCYYPDGASRFAWGQANVYYDFAGYRAASGQDAHGMCNNPWMVSPPSDMHLQIISPCIDAGADVGIYIDFEGNSRPQGAGFEIGAYEAPREPPPPPPPGHNWFGNDNGSFIRGFGSWIHDPEAIVEIVPSFLDEDSACRVELNYEVDYIADISAYRGLNYLSFWVNHGTGIYTMWTLDADGRCNGSWSKSGINEVIDTIFIPNDAVMGYFRLEPLGLEYSDFDECALWSVIQRPPPRELLPVILPPPIPPPGASHGI